MGKVSIGLRGWRFEESAVFDGDGNVRPLAEMPEDVSERLLRLTALIGEPCDACWLLHGDENLQACNVTAVVYGEPRAEVALCDRHENDFVYWFQEEGGKAFRGSDELPDEFHEWFLDGGRVPEDFEGIQHVDTAPGDLPEQSDQSAGRIELPEEERHEIDLRDVDLSRDYPS